MEEGWAGWVDIDLRASDDRGGARRGEGDTSVSCGRSCHRHLGRDRPLTLKLELVPLKRLLPAALEVGAIVVFRHTVLNE